MAHVVLEGRSCLTLFGVSMFDPNDEALNSWVLDQFSHFSLPARIGGMLRFPAVACLSCSACAPTLRLDDGTVENRVLPISMDDLQNETYHLMR